MFVKAAILLILLGYVTLGCASYSVGTLSYRDHPELRTVRLFTGRPDPQGENLGTVEVVRHGRGDCSELASAALAELLEEARAMDGTGLKEVRFRGRFHWAGRVLCRRSLIRKSVQVRGIVTR
jgi:hypothetical protein